MPPITNVKASLIGFFDVHFAMPTPIRVFTPEKAIPTADPRISGGIVLTVYFSVAEVVETSSLCCVRERERLIKERIMLTNPMIAPIPPRNPVASGACDQRESIHRPRATNISTVIVNWLPTERKGAISRITDDDGNRGGVEDIKHQRRSE